MSCVCVCVCVCADSLGLILDDCRMFKVSSTWGSIFPQMFKGGLGGHAAGPTM